MVMISCILFNLIAGNLYLYNSGRKSFGGNPNYYLMATMSVTCIACYYYLFTKIPIYHYSTFVLMLLSIATCYAIIFIGVVATFIATGICVEGGRNVSNFAKGIFTNTWATLKKTMLLVTAGIFGCIFAGTMACILFSHVALTAGLLNTFWLIIFKQQYLQ